MNLKRLTLPVLLAGAIGCAAASKGKSGLEKVAEPPEEVVRIVIEELEQELSASELLVKAMASYQDGAYSESVDFFSRAINTRNLNEAGTALSYWHIGTAYNRLGDIDNECEAMSSFVAVAEGIINIRESRRFAENEGVDFVEGFELESKLTQARTILNSVWAKRSNYFGRSEDFCIPVENKEDLEYFLQLFTVGCPEGSKSVVNRLEDGAHRAVVGCGSGSEELYFHMLSDSEGE